MSSANAATQMFFLFDNSWVLQANYGNIRLKCLFWTRTVATKLCVPPPWARFFFWKRGFLEPMGKGPNFCPETQNRSTLANPKHWIGNPGTHDTNRVEFWPCKITRLLARRQTDTIFWQGFVSWRSDGPRWRTRSAQLWRGMWPHVMDHTEHLRDDQAKEVEVAKSSADAEKEVYMARIISFWQKGPYYWWIACQERRDESNNRGTSYSLGGWNLEKAHQEEKGICTGDSRTHSRGLESTCLECPQKSEVKIDELQGILATHKLEE